MRTPVLSVLTMLIAAGCTSRTPLDPDLPPLARDRLTVTYDDRIEDQFAVSDAQWREIAGLFEPPAASPREERLAIRKAVARFEQIAGEQTPVFRDLRKNSTSPDGCGNVDCRCESTNTTTWLRLLQQERLLKWHVVLGKAFRDFVHFDTHFSAQIRDETDGVRYVVDSWYQDNGELPLIQKTDDWMWRGEEDPAENPVLHRDDAIAGD
jgi:hypothetical protein